MFKELQEIQQLERELEIVKRIHRIQVAINFHIDAILATEDVGFIKLHIEAMQYIEDQNFNEGFDIKEKIREGYEGFILIKDKCIHLGVV